MVKIKKIINDVLYVSKLTKTTNKKVLITLSIILSQLSAGTDILLIGLFTFLITGQETNIETINNVLSFISENLYLLFLLVIFRFIFNFTQQMILKRIQSAVDINLKAYIMEDIFKKRNFSTADSYFYLNQLSSHISFFYSNIASLINNLLQILMYFSYLFISESQVVVIFLFSAILISIPFRYFLSKSRQSMHDSYVQTQQFNRDAQRVLDNLFLINILKKEEYELNSFRKTLKKYRHFYIKNFQYSLYNTFLPSFFALILISSAISIKTYAQKITLDFMGVLLRMFQAASNVTNSINQVVNSHVHIEMFYKLSKEDNFVYKQPTITNEGFIELENISFQYINSDEEMFKDLSLKIKQNTHSLIVGPNGSGKSTLLALIAGILYPKKGNIKTFSKNIGYVGPNPLIFDATLKENLLYGNESSIPDKEIIRQLKTFKVFDTDKSLNEQISNKSLSSGQMQKISFIRALLSNPDILILDEASSNLDKNSKELIYKILSNLNTTILNSTHEGDNYLNIDSTISISVENGIRKVAFI